MISPQAPVVDSNGKITPVWFRWLSELRGNADAGASQADMDAAIAAIATALGSPDGTVANIPPQSEADIRLLQGEGIAITGDAENGYAIAIRPLRDSGTGALLGITRDVYGRVSGTTDATITGTAGQIDVSNGDAAAGPPTLSLADVTDAGGGTLQKTAFDAKGRKTGTSAATTSDLTEGSRLYFTDERAQAAVVAPTITPGDTTHAPSGDAVNTALGLKGNLSGGNTWAGVQTFTGTPSFNSGGAAMSAAAGNNRSFRFQTAGVDRVVLGCSGAAETGANAGSEVFCNVYSDAGALLYTPFSIYRNSQTARWRCNFEFSADNTLTAGTPTFRIKEIHCANNVINTSDAREKTPLSPLDNVELAIARDLAGIVGIYQWLAAIAEKGEDGARLHCGAIAQQVIAAFEAHGRDAFRYGIACYDEWPESREPATDDPPEVIRPAGNRYSLRYGELSMFLHAWAAHDLAATKAELADLRDRVQALEARA